jgi:hypothetical protein
MFSKLHVADILSHLDNVRGLMIDRLNYFGLLLTLNDFVKYLDVVAVSAAAGLRLVASCEARTRTTRIRT